jgi:DNA repair protein RecN (Recombination protein N)
LPLILLNMLVKLAINNIALIEAVELDFGPGFNVLTGETGAGKSIIIDSMNLALGARSDREIIKAGTAEARVEMLFDVSGNEAVMEALREMEMDAGDGSLVISRQLNASGRNVCRVNGALATVAQLRGITSMLIDIHGQHEHQSLLNESRHIDILDGFGGTALLALRGEFAGTWRKYRGLLDSMRSLFGTEQERARRTDILRYQINEIKAANLEPGEDEELTKQLQVLQHAEEISRALQAAYDALYAGGGGASALDGAGAAGRELSRIGQYGEEFSALESRLEQVVLELEDISAEIRRKTEGNDYDEHALNDTENRLDTIRQLKRKYGGSIPGVLETLSAMERELDALENADERMGQMVAESKALEAELLAAGAKLTALRRETASSFQRQVEGQLEDLGMKHSKFLVEFEEREGAVEDTGSPKGFDRIKFLISPNPGEPLKPLAKIASGGEMSRIMLALKNIAAKADSIPTLIFDEIDTGISGNMARVVAEKLANIALGHQVICVTHTAQIAAMGGCHFFIEKNTDGVTTQTSVAPLGEQNRVDEIGRLVGGDVSSLSREHAREMLDWSRRYREGLKNEKLN